MKISFVIPAYNEENYIGDCLDAITKQTRGSSYDTEIIVVDNASTDGTDAVVRKFPEVQLVYEKEKGIVKARRAGYLASSGDLIANIDSDTRILPGWLDKVMSAFNKDQNLVAFSGPFIYYDAPRKVQISTRIFYYIGYVFYLINRFILHAGSMLQGGNFIVRRTALEKIGGYNTSIDFYGEDTDVARRLSKVGKVTFTFKLPANSSGRRLAKEGGLTTGLRYSLNYFWMTFFKKPFSKNSVDIRLKNRNTPFYEPQNRTKEFFIAAGAILIFILCVGGAGYVAYRFIASTTTGALYLLRIETAAKQSSQQIQEKLNELSTTTKKFIEGTSGTN